MTNGVYEWREIGDQPLYFKILANLLKNKVVTNPAHPATSLVMVDEMTIESMPDKSDWGNMNFGFEYYWENKVFCFHLGHGGKDIPDYDMLRLEKIKSFILDRDSNVK
jgi:hypothetical protein